MSRADDVAQKIREAADHPKAPLLFAIGAERPKPQSAASEAYVLELTVQEEKLAKWVAVLKRDAEEFFGKPFLEALRDILKEGENEMAIEVKRGAGFFRIKGNPLIKKLADDLISAGLKFINSIGEELTSADDVSSIYFDNRGVVQMVKISGSHIRSNIEFRCHAVSSEKFIVIDDSGFLDITFRVKDQQAMKAARAFARAWEAKSKQLKGSREATVTIYQDFA